MEKEEYWEHFLMSGKVADYLDYRQAAKQAEVKNRSDAKAQSVSVQDDKVKQHAGFY